MYISRMVQCILQKSLLMCLFLRWDFRSRVWFREVFSFFWGTLFLFFLPSSLDWWCLLPVFPRTCTFPFLQTFWLLLEFSILVILVFIFVHFSLCAWHIFLRQIPFLYPGCTFLLILSNTNSFFLFFPNRISLLLSLLFTPKRFSHQR